jgi:cell division protein FtsI/penicillin-binding protein 2
MDAMKRTQWVASFVLIATAGLLAGLAGRVVWIQRHVTADMRERLGRQYTAVIPLMADRQAILFADGTPAALSVRMYNLFADPGFIMDPEGKLNPLKDEEIEAARQKLVQVLSPLVNKPEQDLRFEIEKNATYANGKPRRFLWLAREVDEDFYNRFMALKSRLREESRDVLKSEGKSRDSDVRNEAASKAAVLYHALDGVGFAKSMKRVYPMGQLAGSVIGIANRYEGVDGMEHQLNDMLKGIDGRMYVTKDAARHTLLIQDQTYTPADNGRSVWLTINSVVQGIAEEQLQQAVEEHGALSGTAVVMDPFSGRIVAIANYPFFDPAHFSQADPDSRRDRAVTDPYEPGSIFKPFVLAWALEKHIVKPTDVIDCHGGMFHDPTGRLVRDTHGYGLLSVSDILVKSSNVGMTQIGWKMGIPTLHEAVTRFGFGQRTGVELPGDQKGLVKPLSQWNKGTLTSVSFGYEVAATPLQLVRAFATFANGGYLVTPRVISAVEEMPGKVVPWSDVGRMPVQQQIISTQTCDTMRNIMAEVLGPRGTARSATSKIYRMYGKTGTAHVAAGSHGQEGHGYGDKDYDSSFLVGGPMASPRLVAIVTLHKPDLKNGYYGGTVAAPAAVAILERSLMYMQVPGDAAEAPAPAAGGSRRILAEH